MPPARDKAVAGAQHRRVNMHKALYGEDNDRTPMSSRSLTPHASYEGAGEAFHDETLTPKVRAKAPSKVTRHTTRRRRPQHRPKMMWHQRGALRRNEDIKEYLERLDAQRRECLRRGDQKREELRTLMRHSYPQIFDLIDSRDSFITASLDRYYTHLLPPPVCVYDDDHTHAHSGATEPLWCVGGETGVRGVEVGKGNRRRRRRKRGGKGDRGRSTGVSAKEGS